MTRSFGNKFAEVLVGYKFSDAAVVVLEQNIWQAETSVLFVQEPYLALRNHSAAVGYGVVAVSEVGIRVTAEENLVNPWLRGLVDSHSYYINLLVIQVVGNLGKFIEARFVAELGALEIPDL